MVQAVGMEPPPVGTVIVFAPLDRSTMSTDPGLAVLVVGSGLMVASTSSEKTTLTVRMLVVDIYVFSLKLGD